MFNLFNLQQGQAVSGSYLGIPFSGTVQGSRLHTCNRNVLVTIALPKPVTIFQQERDMLLVEVGPDAREDTWMKAA